MDKLRLGFVLIAAAWLLGYTGLTYSWGGSNQGLMRWLQSAQVFRVTRDIDCFEHETGSGPEFELCRTFWEPLETDIIFNPRPLLVFSIPASVYFSTVLAVAVAGLGLVTYSIWASARRRA